MTNLLLNSSVARHHARKWEVYLSKSKRPFERWQPHDQSTWAFQVYKKYNRELYRLIEAHRASSFYTYRQLKQNGATLTDPIGQAFAGCPTGIDNFEDVKDWSNGFNSFDNWVNLSNVTTISSNLETYLASVVGIAILSDPSVLISAPSRAIDGAYVLKQGTGPRTNTTEHVIACTKGDWSSRLAAIERLFGPIPETMREKHGDLEEIRNVRNRFGHAFGRDIDASREHGQIEIAPMEKVTRTTVARLGTAAWRFAQETDRFLLHNHIGDFEAVNYYAKLYPTLLSTVPPGQRAVDFKKAIGRFGGGLRGKIYCKGLVAYWEAL
ncbi:hypothetical protein [Novosphingopyxis baekryungensis]|uniref:hypothetical protein n=1 Tax=Novosphingopyxis baekryungensis TaxID=279369 RepID=UPI0012EBD164|nr:hypothetical protein [Novosphingopyxis baekryungensis]